MEFPVPNETTKRASIDSGPFQMLSGEAQALSPAQLQEYYNTYIAPELKKVALGQGPDLEETAFLAVQSSLVGDYHEALQALMQHINDQRIDPALPYTKAQINAKNDFARLFRDVLAALVALQQALDTSYYTKASNTQYQDAKKEKAAAEKEKMDAMPYPSALQNMVTNFEGQIKSAKQKGETFIFRYMNKGEMTSTSTQGPNFLQKRPTNSFSDGDFKWLTITPAALNPAGLGNSDHDWLLAFVLPANCLNVLQSVTVQLSEEYPEQDPHNQGIIRTKSNEAGAYGIHHQFLANFNMWCIKTIVVIDMVNVQKESSASPFATYTVSKDGTFQEDKNNRDLIAAIVKKLPDSLKDKLLRYIK